MYFARISYTRPVRRLRTIAVTPFSSWVWEQYSVENWVWVPRWVALRSRIGSR